MSPSSASTPSPRPPAIHLRVPIADRERMLWLAEKATELGVATWQAVRFRRSASVSPRGEGAAIRREGARANDHRARAVWRSAGFPKSCPRRRPDAIVQSAGRLAAAARRRLAHRMTSVLATATYSASRAAVRTRRRIEEAETNALARAGWQRTRLAATTLRFETAGIAAVADCPRVATHALRC